ncbi:signal peptidase II [Desulfovibrio litoralis]|uniref:Lipoprotein signal peptidase n=1 Tax=Desulfovibrio litoralis DSM 11393 TaxID=1121455 RepID=A0A1M7T7L0_9BACT|nr:signal peptidase II Aspartic peptidase. MEROPS family A08 [Desulfovibrio litoralis DSM 11393]
MNRYLLICIISVIVIALDQWTKWVTNTVFAIGDSVTIINGFFDLVHVRNRGAAFGFLNNPDTTWQVTFFSIVSVVSSLVILFIAKLARPKEYLLFTALGLILGGALGNLIDRLLHGEVIDFLDFYYNNWHFPAFNVADIAICIGAFLAFIAMFKEDTVRRKKRDS